MYQSPIEISRFRIETDVSRFTDERIFEAVLKACINVDRDELIAALKYDRDQYEKGFADGSAEAQQWINVKDYLPSMEQLVLFINKNRKDFCVHVGKLYFVGPKNCVYFSTRGCGRYHNSIAASHWMPLPELPKEDTK